MAALQERNGSYRILFRFKGKQRTFTVGAVPQSEAEATAGQVDLLLMRLKQGLIELPTGMSIEDFLQCDGKVKKPEEAKASPITFTRLRDQYFETYGNGAMEANSLQTVAMHLRHFKRTLGPDFPMQDLQMSDLQGHINTRMKKKYRGRPLSPATLKKEISSFRAAWNWAGNMGIVKGPFPSRGLVYPKSDEKPPFMTMEEIKRKITAKMTDDEKAELWECLYLRADELEAFLAFVKTRAAHGWIYPLICFAAHTCARRSEILRVLVSDVDLSAMTVLVREKKRSRKQRTTRRVALTPLLADVLKKWLKLHPGGQHLFCHGGEVFRSKKRSKTTGHQNEEVRPSSLKGRMESVQKRELPAMGSITRDEVHDHFKRTVANSPWDMLRGLQVLRHSYISCLASAGVDQRIIDESVGHQTEEQRKRYRHLYPSVVHDAIARAFAPKPPETAKD